MTPLRGAEQLPAGQIAGRVNAQLASHATLVITAPPGAGKSTLLPLTMLQGMCQDGGKVLVLEPRRLAARQIAERMAWMLGEEVGHTVGYRVRRESRVSSATRVEVLTEGILTRMLVDDPTLDGVSVVVFDEFHERSLTSDLALALARESQQLVRPDLRLVIMSATIDTQLICQALQAPLVESQGRMFPVEVLYADVAEALPEAPCPSAQCAEAVAHAIRRAHREAEGDILAFLPGEAEIRRCMELLPDGALSPTTEVLPLYGMLSPAEQRRAIAPSIPGQRKVVLATSIAETSLTIDGVRVVVDSGLCRTMAFDARTGLSHLTTVRISMDMARQRSGRAGRVAPGVCYRLWTKATELRMAECRVPEILDADLAPLVLDVAAWGESQPSRLQWLTPPPSSHLAQGASLLRLLGAVGADGRITRHGRLLWRHPYHPRLAQMMVHAEATGQLALGRRLAEVLEAPPSSWPRQLSEPGTGALLACAYPERVAKAEANGIGRYRTASGEVATVEADHPLASHPWIAIASMNAVGQGRVFLAAPVEPAELSHMIQERDNMTWDNKQGCLLARRERRLGMLLVDSRPLPFNDEQRAAAVAAICEAAHKYGTSMLDFGDDVLSLQRRVSTVAEWHPELALPDLSTDHVLTQSEKWLPFYIGKATTTVELKKIDVATALWGLLDYEQQTAVDRLAPVHLALPSGRRIRVEYRQGAELPIVRVRLQECFGMAETPRVDGGARPVLMELLSPGFKPVQLTQDLRSFWSGTYFEVRKELRRRYPKHAWPEDPARYLE